MIYLSKTVKKPKIGNVNFLENQIKKKPKNILRNLKKYLIKRGIKVRL